MSIPTKRVEIRELELPRLEIPDLHASVQRYLDVMKMTTQPVEFAVIETALRRFESQEGRDVHAELVRLADIVAYYPQLVTEDRYLSDRRSLLQGNDFYMAFEFPPPLEQSHPADLAALLIGAGVSTRERIVKRQVHQDKHRGEPQSMAQFDSIFGTCRLPWHDKDRWFDSADSRHVVVMCQGNFFPITVYQGGKRVEYAEIREQCRLIWQTKQPTNFPVGALTALPRDEWAQLYIELSKSEVNRRSFECVQSAMFVVGIDSNPVEDLDQVLNQVWSGNPGNRYYDKPFQLVVFPNGRVGYHLEHTMFDGVTAGLVHVEIFKELLGIISETPDDKPTVTSMPKPLEWSAPEAICATAKEMALGGIHLRNDCQIISHKLDIFDLQEFNELPVNRDAILQFATQLAFYRMHKRLPVTYEPVALRRFYHGRVGGLRPVTEQSARLVHLLASGVNPASSQVGAALADAAAQHAKGIELSQHGFGVDRYFDALYWIAEKTSPAALELLDQAGYRSHFERFDYTTSTVQTQGGGTGAFAPPSGGPGIVYLIEPDGLRLTLIGEDVSPFLEQIVQALNIFHLALTGSSTTPRLDDT